MNKQLHCFRKHAYLAQDDLGAGGRTPGMLSHVRNDTEARLPTLCSPALPFCKAGGSWIHSTWCCWVRQISSILSLSRSLIPIVSIASLKSLRSCSISTSAATTVLCQLFSGGIAAAVLLQLLNIPRIPLKDTGREGGCLCQLRLRSAAKNATNPA